MKLSGNTWGNEEAKWTYTQTRLANYGILSHCSENMNCSRHEQALLQAADDYGNHINEEHPGLYSDSYEAFRYRFDHKPINIYWCPYPGQGINCGEIESGGYTPNDKGTYYWTMSGDNDSDLGKGFQRMVYNAVHELAHIYWWRQHPTLNVPYNYSGHRAEILLPNPSATTFVYQMHPCISRFPDCNSDSEFYADMVIAHIYDAWGPKYEDYLDWPSGLNPKEWMEIYGP
jgi:hypothetical protein